MIWAHITVFCPSFKLEGENCWLTCQDLLHQYFPTLLAHSFKLKTFWITKNLSVFCLMCSCFLDATQNLLIHLNANDERLWLAQRYLSCRWVVIPPHVKTAVRHSDWLYKLFSQVKTKHIDFYIEALWNKILVISVINSIQLWRYLSCRWLVILSQVKTAVCHSDWLYKLFSHVKIKHNRFLQISFMK